MKLDLVDPFTADAESTWRELEDAEPRSFFLSWGWNENWLASLPADAVPLLAVVRDEQRGAVAAFFLSRRNVARLGIVGSRALFFNATGIPRYDDVWIEHNGLVGRDLSVGRLIDLLPDDWDELFLPGLRADAFGSLRESVFRGFQVRIERTVPVHVVDLERARASGYLSLLGGQTRAQVRRAQREAGVYEVEVAHDVPTALEIYDELTRLHQAQWHAKGQPGAFADPWFDKLHRRLIARRFAHGEIQLLRLRGTSSTIGALYNFIYRGRVLQYQSGMATFANRHLKPGYLAHTAAIEHATASGHAVYDFLGGDARYKESLGTDRTSLIWVRVQRQRMRFLVEDRLRGWVRSRRRPSEQPRT